LDGHLGRLIAEGACLFFQGTCMPVPIPVHAYSLPAGDCLLWASGSSPYGARNPCVGRLAVSAWDADASTGGLRLESPDAPPLLVVPLRCLHIGHDRRRRLMEDLRRHEQRIALDASYASIWAHALRPARPGVGGL
jgi:hypothetical protein